MSRLTSTLSLVTALLSGGIYDTASANPISSATRNETPIIQPIQSNDENRRIMMDARIAMGGELKRK
ncbi:hypothetical protein [Rhodopirellula sp. P2]|uniref:hypothetical protein n=1 Tax=Rhodopirellula sp. P2 TaxID=2127060 RepID=UPI0023687FE9|nr:hypothetical protein [Rhodopirellula sp. P2]WDQ16454.1 hypothetical protein PSR62_22930 [Rhodopirellula sp. P2]